MATWPSTLPQSLLYTLTETRQPGKVRSDMDTGPAKQRARFTAVTKYYEGSIILTQAQLATFNTFYETTLGHGTVEFTWIDPFLGTSATLRFGEGEPKPSMIRPSDTKSERLYSVTLPKIERLP